MPELNLLISLLIPFSAGYMLIRLLFHDRLREPLLKIALAYGLGLGLLAGWMLCLGIFRLAFNARSIGAPVILLAIIFFVLGLAMKRSPDPEANLFTVRPEEKNRSNGAMPILNAFFVACLWVYILSNVVYVFWRSMAIPISEWDAIATVAFKAKIFFYEQRLPPLDQLPHKTYPLFVPFIQSWIAFTLGHWDEFLVKIIFPCAFLSYLIVHYKFLSYFTNRTWATLGSAILLSSNFFLYHATISYGDFFLMYFNCITIMLLLFWHETKASPFLILAGLFAGFATFTKLEGTAFLGIYLIIFSLINFPPKTVPLKAKLANTIKFCVPSIGMSLVFHFYKIWNKVLQDGPGIVDKTKIDLTWEKVLMIPGILTGFLKNLLFSGNWNMIWFLAFLSLIHLPRKRTNIEIRLTFLSLILFFGLYIGVALLTVNYIWIAGSESSTTLSRLILHFFPLSVLLIILLNYPGTLGTRKNTSSLNPKKHARNK